MPTTDDRKPPRIPPHIGWPLLVIFLLVLSVSVGVVAIIAATSDGGVQLVEDAP
jgi:hypothetical protein